MEARAENSDRIRAYGTIFDQPLDRQAGGSGAGQRRLSEEGKVEGDNCDQPERPDEICGQFNQFYGRDEQ